MADMNEVNGYQEYQGKMQDLTQDHYPEFSEYLAAHQRPGEGPIVDRSGKSDSEKKDQSRFEPNTFSSMGK